MALLRAAHAVSAHPPTIAGDKREEHWNTIMIEIPETDLARRISMAKSFLDSAQLIERTTHYILAESPEEVESKAVDTQYRRKMIAHFLYAVIFELCIKIIWEIEHTTPPKPNHDILSRYKELSPDSRGRYF